MFKVNNKDTRTKPMANGQWRRSGIFIVNNLEYISYLVLMFLLFTFEQVNVGWVSSKLMTKKPEGINPAIIYLFGVKNRSTRKRCGVCSKVTIKTPERRY